MTVGQVHGSFDNTESLENMANGESSSWQLCSSARHLSVFAMPQKVPSSTLHASYSRPRPCRSMHVPCRPVNNGAYSCGCWTQNISKCLSALQVLQPLSPLFPQIWHRRLSKKKPCLITRSLLYSYINAGQQSPMVGTELAAAQPLDTVAPHHPGPASQQSPAQRSVKCRYFASRKGRQFCS